MKIIKEIYWFFINKFSKIKRVFYWLPIVWRTGDWDSCQALYFFMLKLREVRKTINKNNRHVGDKQKVRRMWELEQVVKRILQEEGSVGYELQYYKDDESFKLEFGDSDSNGLMDLTITEPNFKACCMLKTDLARHNHSQMLMKQDWDLFGTYMKKYFDSWWD